MRNRWPPSWFGGLAWTCCLILLGGCLSKRTTSFNPLTQSTAKQPVESQEAPILDPAQTTDLKLSLGRVAEQQQQWAKALQVYRRVLDADPNHPEATHRMAVLYDRKGDFERSGQWFLKSLKLKPGNADLFCDLGYSLSLQGQLPQAESNLRQALAIDPDHPRAHNLLGVTLARQGRTDDALVAFRAAHCSPAEAHANLAVVLTLHGSAADAERHLLQARQLDDGDRHHRQRLDAIEQLIAAGRQPDAAEDDAEITAHQPAGATLTGAMTSASRGG